MCGMSSAPEPEIIGIPEAATMIGTSRWSVLRLIEAEALVPLRKLPGKTGAVLFNRSDVEAFIARQAEEASA